jgi:hypothetical protein
MKQAQELANKESTDFEISGDVEASAAVPAHIKIVSTDNRVT